MQSVLGRAFAQLTVHLYRVHGVCRAASGRGPCRDHGAALPHPHDLDHRGVCRARGPDRACRVRDACR